MSDQPTKRIATAETHSVKLLHERIQDFDVQKYIDRWHRYTVQEKIGEGGMAIVHHGVDTELSRDVAIKVVSDGSNKDVVERFLDEIQLHARLQHPSTAPMYDFGLTPDGDLFLTMELVFGESLKSVIQQYHASTSGQDEVHFTDLLEKFARICDALSFAHSIGIVHRDVKPDNIMCGEFGKVFLMDWGLATTFKNKSAHDSQRLLAVPTDEERAAAHAEIKKSIADKRDKPQRKRLPTVKLAHQSMLGSVVGTVGYMPPEQALGRFDAVDSRSDIYALGCILYAILCGAPPVAVEDETKLWQALDSVIDGKILSPDARGGKHAVPKGLARIAMTALEREPRDRYQSVEQLRNAVLDWIHQQAEASIVIIEVEETVNAAEDDLRDGNPKAAMKALQGLTEKIEGVDGTERLLNAIKSLHERAEKEISLKAERESTLRSYKLLREATVESQFGLILSHLRLPAPTVRRAHDRLLKALKSSGVWVDPTGMMHKFKLHVRDQSDNAYPESELREQLIYGLFLFGWASTRMAEITSEEHGREMFMNHAETAMMRLNELAASYRAPKLILARIKRLRGADDEADKLEETANDTSVLTAGDYIFLATVAFSEYKLTEARDQLMTAQALDPGAFWGHALMIFVSNGLGDQRGAFSALYTCQAMQPREPNLWTMRGFLERELGQFDKAIESLDRALRYGPNDPLARLIRADLRQRLGRIDWQRDLDYAADLVTPPVSTWDHFVLSLVSLYKNDLEYALEFVKAAQHRSSEMPQLYGLEAAILARSGKIDEAEKLFRKALAMAPYDPRLSESLLALLVHTQRYAEARAKYLIDEEHRPNSSTPTIYLLAARAFAGYAGGDSDEESTDETRIFQLLEKAAVTRTIARIEVDEAPEFEPLRERPEYKRIYRMLREGLPSPRLFQPTFDDNLGDGGLRS